MKKIRTIKVDVWTDDGLRYIDREQKKEIGIYESYFVDRTDSVQDIASYALALEKEQQSDAVGKSEIVVFDDDSDTWTLALIAID
jgi:hypothetical protein